jgi:hypothetical protein
MYRAVGQNQLSAQSVAQWLVTVLGTQPDTRYGGLVRQVGR